MLNSFNRSRFTTVGTLDARRQHHATGGALDI